METAILLAAALLPAAALFVYTWKKDPQPEPTRWLVKAVAWGMVIVVPVALIELGIEQLLFGGEANTLPATTLMSFVGIALPEEGFKLLALWLVLRKNPYFDEHFDGIVYAVCVGLGFAAVENVGYLADSGDEWISVAVIRALLAVPGHYAFAVIMGYFYSVYHFIDRSPRTAVCVLLLPVVAHGLYDSIALATSVSPDIGALGFLVLVFFCIRVHKFARTRMLTQIERDRQRQQWQAFFEGQPPHTINENNEQ